MADHLKAVNILKKITIEIGDNNKMWVRLEGFSKDINKLVSNEYYEKTKYICERYCPEVLSED